MEKGKLIVIRTSVLQESVNTIEVDYEEGRLSDVVRKYVDGWLENVHPKGLERPYCMIVDEEGLIKELPINMIGSELYNHKTLGFQPIVGNIVIVKEQMVNGEIDWALLNDNDVEQVKEMIVKVLKH